jgi:uncharacterized protein YndB with AHSA1/START domain
MFAITRCHQYSIRGRIHGNLERMDMGELVINHEFAAPRAALWAAFTEPEILAEWFGPEGWGVHVDTVTIEPRIGGVQKFVMHLLEDPTQTSPVHAKFTEVREHELLVGEDGPHEMTLNLVITMRVEFADCPMGTALTITQGPLPGEVLVPARAGWESSFTKLEALFAAHL